MSEIIKEKIRFLVVAISTVDGSVSDVDQFEFDEFPIDEDDYENMVGGSIDWVMNPLEDILDELSQPEGHVEVNLTDDGEEMYEHNYLIVRI